MRNEKAARDHAELMEVRRALTERLPLEERVAAAKKTTVELIAAVASHVSEEQTLTAEAQALVEAAATDRARVTHALELAGPHGHDDAIRALALRLRQHLEAANTVKTLVIPAILQATVSGRVPVTRGTVAHLKDLINEESGAVEVALTDTEIADLLQGGTTFTEVSNGEDILLRVVDTTGTLSKLRGLFDDYRAQHPMEAGR